MENDTLFPTTFLGRNLPYSGQIIRDERGYRFFDFEKCLTVKDGEELVVDEIKMIAKVIGKKGKVKSKCKLIERVDAKR